MKSLSAELPYRLTSPLVSTRFQFRFSVAAVVQLAGLSIVNEASAGLWGCGMLSQAAFASFDAPELHKLHCVW